MANMNWATIEPETRLYKGKDLFRWDDTPGLEHHCGTCATPLANPRAKTSCIGKHVEPCYRFHQQLHFVGKSHECFGCNSSDETHHIRHKEILRLIRQIEALDASLTGITNSLDTSGLSRRSSTTITSSSTETRSETFVSDIKATKRARKKAKKNVGGSAQKIQAEVFQAYELDFVSEAIHLRVIESKGAWQGTYSYGNTRGNCINTTVLAANQALEDGEDLPNDTVEGCTVPGGKKLDEMTPRQRRIHTYAWRKEGSQTRKYNPSILNKSNSIYCGVDPEIFVRLRIEVVNPAVNSKIRKELVAKLVAAIKEDLDIQTREDGESEMRKEGFYRWAGKTALQHMERTREGIDWATGQKITAKAEEMLDIDTPRRETFTKQLSCDSLAVKKYLSAGKVPALPSISVKTPVWTKTLRITISPASLDAVDDTPTKRKPERPPLPTAPGTTFILQGCTGPHGKRITYSKMLQSNNGSYGVIDNKENIFPDTWKPANVPAEGFFEHNENNDDEGWSIVGSGKRRNGSVQI